VASPGARIESNVGGAKLRISGGLAGSKGGALVGIWGNGQSPQKLINKTNFVLRITLVNAYCPLYSS